MPDRATPRGQQSQPASPRTSQPVVVGLGPVDPALVSGVLDVLDGREPRAVANPGWRADRAADSKEISV
jgi:hypothetical protein